MKRGNQIILRDFIKEDLEIYRKRNIGHQRWMDFDAPYFSKPSEEEVDSRITEINHLIQSEKWNIPRKRLVIAHLDNNSLIGTVSWYWQSKETFWKSIGIVIYDEVDWGKGIGFEALQLWIDYLFENSKEIVRLDLRTWSENRGMISLAKKLGFKEEARFRMARIVNEEYYDSIAMGILRSEWVKMI